MIVSDAPSCSVTYDCHSDDSRGVIHNRNMIRVQATGIKGRTPTKIRVLFLPWDLWTESSRFRVGVRGGKMWPEWLEDWKNHPILVAKPVAKIYWQSKTFTSNCYWMLNKYNKPCSGTAHLSKNVNSAQVKVRNGKISPNLVTLDVAPVLFLSRATDQWPML
jgi:hypothetical protein